MINKRTFHALRHTSNSEMANRGVPEERRMKATGHSSKAVHRGYTHYEMEVLRGDINKIPAIPELPAK